MVWAGMADGGATQEPRAPERCADLVPLIGCGAGEGNADGGNVGVGEAQPAAALLVMLCCWCRENQRAPGLYQHRRFCKGRVLSVTGVFSPS